MGIATNSKGNIYIYHRAYETRLFEYSPQGVFIREIGRNNYGFAFAHSVRVDAQDNIWAVDEGTDMLVKFAPDGRVLMTIGRREDPVRMLANMPGAGVYPRPQREVHVRPPDRRGLRSAGQHLRVGRLLRRARREVRQERPVREGRGHARQRQPAVQHAALDRHRLPGQRLRGRPRQPARAGAGQRPELEGQLPERRQPVGGVRVGRARAEESGQAVSLRLELVARQRSGGGGRVHRRDLQDGARRHHRRQVRPRRQGAGRVRHHSPDRLPRPRRPLHRRDQRLAVAEDSAEARGARAPARTRGPRRCDA